MNARAAVVAEAEMPKPIVFGDLVFDVMKRKVLCKNEPFRLTGQEYKVLFYIFCLVQGKQFARKDELYEYLYSGTNSQPDGNVINVFVCKLRRRLEKAESICTIETIWGKGYKPSLHSEVTSAT